MSAAPSNARPGSAAEAATNELDQVRRNINTATRPGLSARPKNHIMAPADFDPIARDPGFSGLRYVGCATTKCSARSITGSRTTPSAVN